MIAVQAVDKKKAVIPISTNSGKVYSIRVHTISKSCNYNFLFMADTNQLLLTALERPIQHSQKLYFSSLH